MFKQRLMTALCLIPLVLMIMLIPKLWVPAMGLIVLILSYEWSFLVPIQSRILRWGYMALMLLLSLMAVMFVKQSLWLDLLIWLMITAALLTYPKSQAIWGRPWVVMFLSVLLLPGFVVGVWNILKWHQGPQALFYLLCLVWATDIGAYAAGKWLGRHKLIPKVSPGKTYEGALGGVVFAMVFAKIGFMYFNAASSGSWFGLAVIIVLASMVGDLFVSMLKRRVKLKDTGHILPGHGGLLDRLDSLLAAAPFFCVLYRGIF